MSKKTTSHEELMSILNQDPEFREAYERLDPYFEIINEVTHLRKRLGLTQQQLADKMGDHQSAISRLETGAHAISLEKLILIAEALEAKVKLVPIERSGQREFEKLFLSSISSGAAESVSFSETAVTRLSINSETSVEES